MAHIFILALSTSERLSDKGITFICFLLCDIVYCDWHSIGHYTESTLCLISISNHMLLTEVMKAPALYDSGLVKFTQSLQSSSLIGTYTFQHLVRDLNFH